MIFKINCYKGIDKGVFGEPYNTWYTHRGLGGRIYDLRGRVSDKQIVFAINNRKEKFREKTGKKDLSYDNLYKKHLCHEIYDFMKKELDNLLEEIK